MEKERNNRVIKIFIYLNNSFRYIIFGIIILGFLVVGLAMFFGAINIVSLENQEFIKYLANISFILAGFTFLTFFSVDKDRFKERLISPCWLFILAGFLLLAFMIIPYVSEGGFIFDLLRKYNNIIGFSGLSFFFFGLVSLVIVIFIEQERIHEIINKKKDKKNMEMILEMKKHSKSNQLETLDGK